MPLTQINSLPSPVHDSPNRPEVDFDALNAVLDTRLVARFASVAERDSKIPTPVDNQVCGVAGYPQIYRAGAWHGSQSYIYTAAPFTAVTSFTTAGNIMRTINLPDIGGVPYRVLVDAQLQALVSAGSDWNFTARIDSLSGELIRPVGGLQATQYTEVRIVGGVSSVLTGAHSLLLCSQRITGAAGDGFEIRGEPNVQQYRIQVTPV
jgi:hypothetical protein